MVNDCSSLNLWICTSLCMKLLVKCILTFHPKGTFSVFSEFLGCLKDTSDFNITFESAMTHASLTQCIQLCLGFDQPYAGVQDSICFCYSNTSMQQTSTGKCRSCDGYPGQACGDLDNNTTAVVDLGTCRIRLG